ncbi:MAG TPA: hypothetical protein VHB27_18910 [Rhodopila sp.]|uniref:hypothetical protein n=1 Tax=Rhodopila sp. TaxID=2480087 RepID=UPI002B79376C|nr:hypothetical protein [Rhodopila sp.]HVY17301.1 hypothetical protein [Rhodopila sp.]
MPPSDVELVTAFESLGDNCELGLLQRRVYAEPLGLLRFAGISLASLVTGLRTRFAGIADAEAVRIVPENGEYMVHLPRHGIVYHADAKVGQADPDALHRQQARILPFLADKLVADLTSGEKTMVFRQNEPLLANGLNDLRQAVATYGPAVLLWVQAARPGHPAGSVDVIDDRLMVGYVSGLAPRHHVPDLDVPSWIAMLRQAHARRPEARRPEVRRPEARRPEGAAAVAAAASPPAPDRIEVAFGVDGNAAAYLGEGWSGQEKGYCWSVNDRSALRLPVPRPADRYRVDMHVVPFTAPPALPGQRLGVVVNGSMVHSFNPLPRGDVAFTFPGDILRNRDQIELVFEHPDAASPLQMTGGKDDRRLAAAFRTLSVAASE